MKASRSVRRGINRYRSRHGARNGVFRWPDDMRLEREMSVLKQRHNRNSKISYQEAAARERGQ